MYVIDFNYRAAITAEVVSDVEESNETDHQAVLNKKENPQYVEIVDPFASEVSFVKSECVHRKVIKVVCDHLGMQKYINAYSIFQDLLIFVDICIL